jgi:hypothetical protein
MTMMTMTTTTTTVDDNEGREAGSHSQLDARTHQLNKIDVTRGRDAMKEGGGAEATN